MKGSPLRTALVMLFAFFLVLAVVPVRAQDVTPPTDPNTIVNLPEAGGAVAKYVIGLALAAFGASPAAAFIVGLLKKLPQLADIPAQNINLIVCLILWIVAGLATYFGYQVQFKSLLDVIAQAGPVLVAFLATLLGAPVWHHNAAKFDVPVIGYVRTEDADVQMVQGKKVPLS